MAIHPRPIAPPPPRGDDHEAFQRLVEPLRVELHRHCYRMTGDRHDAEDLVQETLLRAWRARGTLAAASMVRAWLYRIATRACLDELERRPRSVRRAPLPQPIAGSAHTGPEAHYDLWESARLAFLAVIQHLPPRQRVVLLLREALGCSAAETAAMLDMTVASANSALQRARTTLRARFGAVDASSWVRPASEAERSILERYLSAWEQSDVDGLIALLRDEARPGT